MLPKNIRLVKSEISRIARYGKKYSNEYFDVKTWWDDSVVVPKFAISISTKIDKRATVRNYIKRKLRVAIRDLIKSTPNLKKGSYVIIVRSVTLQDLTVDQIKSLLSNVR